MAFTKDFSFTSEEVREELRKNKSSDILLLLLDLLENVTQSTSFDELLNKVGDASQKLMRVEVCSLMLLDASGEYLTIVMPTGPVRDEIKGKKISADHGYAGWVIQNEAPVIANDVQQDDKFDGEVSDKFTTNNLICVPLFNSDGSIMGVLEAMNRPDEENFEKADIPIFQVLANHSARTIQRIESKDKAEQLLQEQDILFKEIHHRVKNDFALISGIVEMENIDAADEHVSKVLSDVQSRIQTMASVYDLLANREQESAVKVNVYLEELVYRIARNSSGYRQNIQINTDMDDITLDSHAALSCGLILNELMINSFKHAFKNDGEGTIKVSIKKEQDEVCLIFQDNGEGFSEEFDFEQSDSLGFEIIRALAKQLNATLQVQGEDGAEFIICF